MINHTVLTFDRFFLVKVLAEDANSKRIITNSRQQRRIVSNIKAFDALRLVLPSYMYSGTLINRLSKLQTLRLACRYIKALSDLLSVYPHNIPPYIYNNFQYSYPYPVPVDFSLPIHESKRVKNQETKARATYHDDITYASDNGYFSSMNNESAVECKSPCFSNQRHSSPFLSIEKMKMKMKIGDCEQSSSISDTQKSNNYNWNASLCHSSPFTNPRNHSSFQNNFFEITNLNGVMEDNRFSPIDIDSGKSRAKCNIFFSAPKSTINADGHLFSNSMYLT